MASSKKRLKQAAVLLVAAALIGFGLWGFRQRYRATHNPKPVISTETITHSTDKPDETPPKEACENYQVPPNEPRVIELPGLGKSGCIQKVGVDQNNAIAVPSNIHVAGWFVDSPLPGEKGVSIIDGHVLGRYSQAVFSELNKMKPGDMIRVQFGDKTWKKFRVVNVNEYSVEQTAIEQYKSLEGVDRQLTLITCGGTFDRSSQSYDKRVVVRSKLIQK